MACLADLPHYFAYVLLGPIVTGVAIGLVLRLAPIPGEVTEHDARAEEMVADLIRWVRDRNRYLDAAIIRALNLARQGVIEDVVQAPVPEKMKDLPPGDMSNSGAFVQRVERLMREALHEYRDEASRKVREYGAMARREGWFARRVRRWRGGDVPVPLGLSEDNRETLPTWREREVPVYSTPTARVKDDPTQHADVAADIAPLETADGLTWKGAVATPIQRDSGLSVRRNLPK